MGQQSATVGQVDLHDIEYEKLIDGERFLERLIEQAGEREETERAKSTAAAAAAALRDGISPPPGLAAFDVDLNASPRTRRKQLLQQQQLQQQQGVNSSSAIAQEDERNLRPIVVDGSDVGFCESTQTFELSRIRAVVDYFEKRRHKIFVILPQWRKDQILASPNVRRTNSPTSGAASSSSTSGVATSSSNTTSTITTSTTSSSSTSSTSSSPSSDAAEELERMAKRGILHYTPTRAPSKYKYQEDSAILELAKKKNAVVVSNDSYKKFNQDDKYKEVIDERVLPYTIIDDEFLPSLSSLGNTLENFLRFEPLQDSKFNKKCPYMQKNRCTFGAKCKYWHPERIVAMGPNQGQTQLKTTHQKIIENVSEQKMRFQVILNKTIEASSKVTPIRPIDLDEASANTTKQSSIAAAAAAAATSNTLMAASLTKLLQQQQQQSKTAPPALGPSTASLVPSLERFSLMDSELNEFSPSSLSSSNPLVRSIITNTLGSTSNSASSGASESAAANSSWWPAPAPVLSSDPTPKPINKPLGMVSPVTATVQSSTVAPPRNSSSTPVPAVGGESDDELRQQLCRFFTPEQVDQIMSEYPNEKNYKKLMYYANEKFLDDC